MVVRLRSLALPGVPLMDRSAYAARRHALTEAAEIIAARAAQMDAEGLGLPVEVRAILRATTDAMRDVALRLRLTR